MWKNYLLTRVEKSTPETFAAPFGFKFRRNGKERSLG